ncbi:MAG: MoaD/ThiS family protein [Verrucomicrobiota bacterium]
MEIQVQFFAQLRDAADASALDLELPAGSTAGDLLAAVYERVPALRSWNESILIGAGVEFVGRNHVLQPNEQIALMPPVQGG